MSAEDLQQWTKAYQEDKGHIATYIKLRQGQKYEDFYLTLFRANGENNGGSTQNH